MNTFTAEEAYAWLVSKRAASRMEVHPIALGSVSGWCREEGTGWISHRSGQFFKVMAIRVERAGREVDGWEQPILEQPVPGILGILIHEDSCLLQAKAEPGNVDRVQFAPTIQSTVANLSQAHGGKRPLFCEYFEKCPDLPDLVYAVLQSESGGRFLGKANWNVIVRSREAIAPPDDFIWISLTEIKKLIRMNNVVNAYARSVLCLL